MKTNPSLHSLSYSPCCSPLIRAVECETQVASCTDNPLRLFCSTCRELLEAKFVHRMLSGSTLQERGAFLALLPGRGHGQRQLRAWAGAASPRWEGCQGQTYLGELGNLLAHFHVNFLIAAFSRAAAKGFRSIASPGLRKLVYAGGH